MLEGASDDAPSQAGGDPDRGGGRRFGLALLAWAALAALTLLLSRSPASLALDAPQAEASGARAMEVLRRLAREPGERFSPPRPVGTAANARCRDRIALECRLVGLFPEVDERFAVSTYENVAGTTRNIIARMRGSVGSTEPGRAILCMAHYDSVGAGPGIGDDLAGVAALLEVARALKANGGTRRDVIFLFEDAEEHGLLGAEAFAAQHPWAEDVGVVINLEARGTSGPSRMFETGAGNAWAIDAWAGVADSPSATSVSVEVYRRMPNDTDYTVWRQRGIPGLNFAFIGDSTRYHTPLDDLEHIAPRTLQHHVSNAFSAIQALDKATFPVESGDAVTARGPDAVFFDVAGRSLVTLHVATLRMLASLSLLLALVGVGRGVARGALNWRGVVFGGGGLVVALLVALSIARLDWGLMALLGATAVPFPAYPVPIILSLIGATVGGLVLVCAVLPMLLRSAESGAVVLLLHAFGGLFLSWTMPGAAYLIVLPALVLAVAASLMRVRGDVDTRWERAGIAALCVSAVLWTPLHAGVIAAFGVGSSFVVAVPLLIVGSFAVPSIVRAWVSLSPLSPWVAASGLALAFIAAGLAGTRPTYSPDRPGQVNLVHVQSSEGPARWQVMRTKSRPADEVMGALKSALGLPGRTTETLVIPWSRAPLFAARAQRIDAEMPTFEIVGQRSTKEGGVLVEGRVRSPRGGDQLVLVIAGDCSLRVAGTEMDPHGMAFLAPDPEGHLLEIEFGGEHEVLLQLHDKRFGLDGPLLFRSQRFLEARDSHLVPAHDGDGSLLFSSYVLACDDAGRAGLSALEVEADPELIDGDESE